MSAMKPSDIVWIGKIPTNWDVIRLKLYAYLKGRIGWQGLKAEEFIDEGPYLVTGTDFENGRICWERSYHISEHRYEEAPQIQLRVGDLLVTKDGTIGKLAYVDCLPDKASLNSHLLLIRPLQDKFCNEFLFWVLGSTVFQGYYELASDGTTMDSLSQEKIGNLNFASPPLPEQRAIAAFLDDRCAHVDGIIADLERQVEILRQYKKALITETVTKGLDKSAVMKDSGIGWIGEIPAHWEAKRLRYVCRLKTGTTPSGNDGINIDEDGFQWFTPSDFNPNLALKASEKYISAESVRRYKISLYDKGSVLLVAIGATVGKIGYCDVPAYSNQQITALMPTAINGKYLMYFLHSKTDYIKDNALYTTLPIINNTYLSDIFVCVPRQNERAEIVTFLDGKCAEVDALVVDKELSIETMRQYKRSLIYEYVTGKKRVAS